MSLLYLAIHISESGAKAAGEYGGEVAKEAGIHHNEIVEYGLPAVLFVLAAAAVLTGLKLWLDE